MTKSKYRFNLGPNEIIIPHEDDVSIKMILIDKNGEYSYMYEIETDNTRNFYVAAAIDNEWAEYKAVHWYPILENNERYLIIDKWERI